MAYKDILPTTNLTVSDVRDTLGESTNDIGRLCKSTKINKWAKYKPVASPLINNNTEDRNLGVNMDYGLTIPLFNPISAPTVETLVYPYTKPLGGSSEPFRLGDFRGYKHSAIIPYAISFPNEIYYNYNRQYIYLNLVTDVDNLQVEHVCRALAEKTNWRLGSSMDKKLEVYFGVVIVETVGYSQCWYMTSAVPLYTINETDKPSGALSVDPNSRNVKLALRSIMNDLQPSKRNKVFGIFTTAPVITATRLPASPTNVYLMAMDSTDKCVKYYNNLSTLTIYDPLDYLTQTGGNTLLINQLNLPASGTTVLGVTLTNSARVPTQIPSSGVSNWKCTAISCWGNTVVFPGLTFYSDMACTMPVVFPLTFAVNEVKTLYFKEYFFYKDSVGSTVLPTPREKAWTASIDFRVTSQTMDLDDVYPIHQLFNVVVNRICDL